MCGLGLLSASLITPPPHTPLPASLSHANMMEWQADMSWRDGISTMSAEEEARRLALCDAATPHASIARIALLPLVLEQWAPH